MLRIIGTNVSECGSNKVDKLRKKVQMLEGNVRKEVRMADCRISRSVGRDLLALLLPGWGSAALSLFLLLGGVIAPNPPPAAAASLSLESRTYVPASGIEGGDTHVLFYEYLSLDAGDLGIPGLYVRAGGWGRADIADETFGQKANGDLQYGFLGWRGPSSNAEARLGRLSYTGGAARHSQAV